MDSEQENALFMFKVFLLIRIGERTLKEKEKRGFICAQSWASNR